MRYEEQVLVKSNGKKAEIISSLDVLNKLYKILIHKDFKKIKDVELFRIYPFTGALEDYRHLFLAFTYSKKRIPAQYYHFCFADCVTALNIYTKLQLIFLLWYKDSDYHYTRYNKLVTPLSKIMDNLEETFLWRGVALSQPNSFSFENWCHKHNVCYISSPEDLLNENLKLKDAEINRLKDALETKNNWYVELKQDYDKLKMVYDGYVKDNSALREKVERYDKEYNDLKEKYDAVNRYNKCLREENNELRLSFWCSRGYEYKNSKKGD